MSLLLSHYLSRRLKLLSHAEVYAIIAMKTNLKLAWCCVSHFLYKRLIKRVGPTLNITIIAFTIATQLQITKLTALLV